MSPEQPTAEISTPDEKQRDLARIGYRNPNGSKLLRPVVSQQQIEVARTEKQANKERRKAERDRKRDQRRKQR